MLTRYNVLVGVLQYHVHGGIILYVEVELTVKLV